MFTAPRFFSQNATFLMDFSRAGDAEPQPKVSWPQKSAKDHKEYKQYKPLSLYSLRSFFGKTIRLLTCTQKEGI